jgi:hypothetical protein
MISAPGYSPIIIGDHPNLGEMFCLASLCCSLGIVLVTCDKDVISPVISGIQCDPQERETQNKGHRCKMEAGVSSFYPYFS